MVRVKLVKFAFRLAWPIEPAEASASSSSIDMQMHLSRVECLLAGTPSDYFQQPCESTCLQSVAESSLGWYNAALLTLPGLSA